jgi:DNA-binding NarL/FixJ family response regulator
MNLTGARALVVEDDRSWHGILTELLDDMGLAVDPAGSLDEALALIGAQTHRLAVVDLSLSGGDYYNKDGLKVLDALRRQDPNCAALLLSGYATVELAVSAIKTHGAYSCLQKEHFLRSQFRQLVSQALALAPNRADESAYPGAAAYPAEPGGEAQRGTALVVDDDAGWREILRELLVEAGFNPRACASFGEALGCLRREKFHLAVIDLSLSGAAGASGQAAEGYRLLALARQDGIPTIVVSGVGLPDEIARVYDEYEVYAFVEKQSFDRAGFIRLAGETAAHSSPGGELDGLTGRERGVLRLLAQGLTNKEIAEALVISQNTVKRHLKSIFRKLDIHTRAAAVAKAVALSGEDVVRTE